MWSLFRNKIMTAAALCLCLSMTPVWASAQSVNLIPEDMIVANTANYNTSKVEKGEMQIDFSVNGKIYLPHTYELYPEVGGLKFVEYTVERGDMVQKGDVLAVFSSNVDEVLLSEKKLQLERTRDAYELECKSRREAIDEMHMSLLGVRDSYDAQMMKLKIEREELAFEQYMWQAETNLDAIMREIEDLESQREDSVITAPVDGIIEKTITKRAGNRVYRDELMIVMYRTDGVLVEVDNKMGNLRYGMEVEITVGNINKQSIPGRVVGADYMLPESQQTGLVYVQPDYYDPASTPISNPRVTGKSLWLDNVLSIPRTAMKLETGKNYVMKYEDGITKKRYINALLIRQNVLVLQGLEPGEEIIAN